MTKLDMAVLATMLIGLLGIGIYGFFKEDMHKKLLAKLIRFIESRQRKKIHKSKKRRGI